MSILFTSYARALVRYPLLTKSVTSFIVGESGDIVAQKIVCKEDTFKVNWKRSFLYGGISHYWYGFLQSALTSTGMKKVMTKMCFDQVLFVPTFDALMFFGLSCMENWKNQPKAGVEKVKRCLFPALRANYCVWPILQIINFKFVPLPYQVLYMTTGIFFWNIFLSDLANRKGNDSSH